MSKLIPKRTELIPKRTETQTQTQTQAQTQAQTQTQTQTQAQAHVQTGSRPNVVFVVSDDLGDVTCHGSLSLSSCSRALIG